MNLEYVMKFGKHKGKTLEYVAQYNPKYLLWLSTLSNLDSNLKNIINNIISSTFFEKNLEEYIESERMFIDGCMEGDWSR